MLAVIRYITGMNESLGQLNLWDIGGGRVCDDTSWVFFAEICGILFYKRVFCHAALLLAVAFSSFSVLLILAL